MISVKISSENAPWVGNGRRTIPAFVLKDKRMKEYISERIKQAIKDLQYLGNGRSNEDNPQRILHSLKMDIRERAIERQRKMVPMLIRDINCTQQALERTLNVTPASATEQKAEAARLTERLAMLENKRHTQQRKEVNIKNRIEGETLCKGWCSLGKEKKPRDLIYALKRTQAAPQRPFHEPEYEKNSAKMADLARDYHENLQSQDLEQDELKRIKAEIDVLDHIDKAPTDYQREGLRSLIHRDDVEHALKVSKKDSAAGIDGLTYEFWVELQKQSKATTPDDDQSENDEDGEDDDPPDILDLMTSAFNDIQRHGVDKTTNFAEGWMCPIFKKKDRTDIANYRPITLLNTDYKLYTKALTAKLASAAPTLIHKAQAGFVPGRQIHDHTQLTHMIMELAASADPDEDEDGMIVALDQEKAYDKISHTYLWETLRKFNIPETFINSVKTLYENAETRVMINGFLSAPYKITRGVRQGDPLSCLLFDLAIEPLAASLRASNLRGYNIPGADERLIATLFADDTTTFLRKDDKYSDLMTILDTWCTASGAKFNKEKTEVIPIGHPEYRQQLIATRAATPGGELLPDHIRIAHDGDAIRILGAWHGNDVNEGGIWTPMLEKIDATLARWESRHPTMDGRRHIVQMHIGGTTQYLAKVQGMPKHIEDKLEKRIRSFIWADKKQTPVNKETLFAPISKGGKAVLDIRARNQAIEITWVKDYLNFGPDRPLWALVADTILARAVPKTEERIPPGLRQNTFLQSWKVKISAVPTRLRKILETAKTFGIRREGLAFERDILRSMPIWYHGEADARLRRLQHSKTSRCLQDNHQIMTVGETETLASNLNSPGHNPRRNCACAICKQTRRNTMCESPHACFTKAKELLDLLPEKWDPRQPKPEDSERISHLTEEDRELLGEDKYTLFDASITTRGNLTELFRVFTSGETSKETYQTAAPQHQELPRFTIATDGSCHNNGQADAQAGAGGYAGEGSDENFSLRLPDNLTQSNQTGELVAVTQAGRGTAVDNPLMIESDSEYSIDEANKRRKLHEDRGYIGVINAPIIRAMVGALRQRPRPTIFRWVKGHSGHQLNEGADKLAGEGAKKQEPDVIDLEIDGRLWVSGAKLNIMTQKLAYQGIREYKMSTYEQRRRTGDNMIRAIDNIEVFFGEHPTEAHIWTGIRHKDIRREIRYFLWMTMHDAYMVGTNWQRPGYSDELQTRQECAVCGLTESMEHILSECEAPGQKEIWQLAETVWRGKNKKWPRPSLGAVLSSPIAPYKNTKGKPKSGDTRLYRIIMTESAYLIWKIRCERVIGGAENPNQPLPTLQEIQGRWLHAINDRLATDCQLTNSDKYGNKAIRQSLVERTWGGVLKNEDTLPPNWAKGKSEVLVGIERSDRGRRRTGEG
ncbi:hypothetical protein EVJ58_g5494 [Rhodofomes roseus]|uniref:Reverse transcriptase domain-containing protein n=1 Tax=Rhodofomes roseus TaxID=34475 RepID=A0A4Y9YE94_9APHY|nr:hypothetical protein EVJ58_g5494 [Rhodofomes roseus]